MRKTLLYLLFLLLLFLTPLTVSAQNSNSLDQQNRVEVKERVDQNEIDKKDTRAENTQRVEEKKASQEAQLMVKKQERLRSYWGNLERRISATIERLDILITRIESRLDKITQANPDLDTTKIESDIADAKKLLSEASNLLDTASDNYDNLLLSNDPKTAFESLKETISDIKDLLIETHRILVYLIGDIKGLRVGSGIITPTSQITIPELTTTANVSPTEEPVVIE